MNNKYINKIIALTLILLFVLPVSLKAQTEIETRYEEIPKFSNEELAQMLAPIALYPDALLSQMLIAASYPFEVVEAERWLVKNPGLSGDTLDNALKEKDWDVSVLSLCHYPKVLTMLSENLNWTARLGDAFVNQQQDVMDTVQELRAKASTQGNLTTTNEQKVIVEERIIRIEPAYPNYLYVPVYDPFVVYGPWWYPAFLPFPIFYPGVAVIAGPRIAFAPRIFIGFGAIGWSAFNWPAHNVVIVNIDRTKRFYRHADVYHGPQHYHWKPDYQRRVARERRANEIPGFHPPGKSPRDISGGGYRKGTDVVVPPRSKLSTAGPRVIDKDKRPSLSPKDIDKGGISRSGGPRVIEKDKRPDGTPGVTDRNRTPYANKPRTIDKDKIQSKPGQLKPRVMDGDKPIVRDRGSAGVIKPPQNPPRIENKGVNGSVRGADQGNPNIQRNSPSEGRGGSDRGNERGGGGFEGRR